jgi:hypothetical protein
LPGFAFEYWISSWIVFAGTAGLTTNAFESTPMTPTAVKSRIGSKVRLL